MDKLTEQLAEALRVCEPYLIGRFHTLDRLMDADSRFAAGEAAADLCRLRAALAAYDAAKANGGGANCAALQARIDALMFAFCPNEMTPGQVEEWGKHQRRVSPDKEAKINAALGLPPPPEQTP